MKPIYTLEILMGMVKTIFFVKKKALWLTIIATPLKSFSLIVVVAPIVLFIKITELLYPKT